MTYNLQNPYPYSNEEVLFNQQNIGFGSAVGQARNRIKRYMSKKPEVKSLEEKIPELNRKSKEVLFQTRTIFPFDFFPDTITINENKIDIVRSNFFFSHQITSVPLNDIANVELDTSPFFATLRIINIRYPMEPIKISFLKKSEAVEAKNIIDGLLVFISQGADAASIEPKDFLREIKNVGKSSIKG